MRKNKNQLIIILVSSIIFSCNCYENNNMKQTTSHDFDKMDSTVKRSSLSRESDEAEGSLHTYASESPLNRSFDEFDSETDFSVNSKKISHEPLKKNIPLESIYSGQDMENFSTPSTYQLPQNNSNNNIHQPHPLIKSQSIESYYRQNQKKRGRHRRNESVSSIDSNLSETGKKSQLKKKYKKLRREKDSLKKQIIELNEQMNELNKFKENTFNELKKRDRQYQTLVHTNEVINSKTHMIELENQKLSENNKQLLEENENLKENVLILRKAKDFYIEAYENTKQDESFVNQCRWQKKAFKLHTLVADQDEKTAPGGILKFNNCLDFNYNNSILTYVFHKNIYNWKITHNSIIPLKITNFEKYSKNLKFINYTPDSDNCVTISENSQLKYWYIDRDEFSILLDTNFGEIKNIDISDYKQICINSQDGNVYLWDIRQKNSIKSQIKNNNKTYFSAGAFFGYQKHEIITADTNTISIWDLRHNKSQPVKSKTKENLYVHQIVVNKKAPFVTFNTTLNDIISWNYNYNKEKYFDKTREEKTKLNNIKKLKMNLEISRNGFNYATVYDEEILIWDYKGRFVQSIVTRDRKITGMNKREINTIKFSQNGKYLAYLLNDGAIRIWTPNFNSPFIINSH